MKEKKKKSMGRIIKSTSNDYTFIDDINMTPKENNKEDDKQIKNKTKKKDYAKKTLKDLTATKTHYKSIRQSPKSQQGHSPVYE